jgi:hypothetical protein
LHPPESRSRRMSAVRGPAIVVYHHRSENVAKRTSKSTPVSTALLPEREVTACGWECSNLYAVSHRLICWHRVARVSDYRACFRLHVVAGFGARAGHRLSY